jgi:hypothetical protein
MNTQKKSLALAELMGWEIRPSHIHPDLADEIVDYGELFEIATLAPYVVTPNGLAQFAAILLKFPEVMDNFFKVDGEKQHGIVAFNGQFWVRCEGEIEENYEHFTDESAHPTQANLLDEILRMNGIKI